MTAQFYISAAHKSSGKTTLSIGLGAALSRSGLNVQGYKKGPDYIDPAWLSKATGAAVYNLDFNTQTQQEIINTYQNHGFNKDVLMVEGNMGLFDDTDPNGLSSNAALAKLLNIPVILVIDCIGTSRGVAPLLMGYQQFDSEINYAGVILNKVANASHEEKLLAAVQNYTDFKVLGVMEKDSKLIIPERHLGLVPANESTQTAEAIDYLATKVKQRIDINALTETTNKPINWPAPGIIPTSMPDEPVTIAIARDSAFGFYYPDDLEAMQQAGAELVFFDTMKDKQLPKADGLFIGGGFPETQMQQLEANSELRSQIKTAIKNGLPTYAECGGLMYLCNSIQWQQQQNQMVGAIPATIQMHRKPQGRGLVKYTETNNSIWPQKAPKQEYNAHEFHYASMDLKQSLEFAYDITRGFGINGTQDGVLMNNLIASFTHLRNTKSSPWVERFISFVRQKAKS